MPPKYSYAVLGASTVLLGGLWGYMGGNSAEGLPLLLLLLSPFVLFAVAAHAAKRNLIVRVAVLFGCLFLALDCAILYGVSESKSSTSGIGLGIAAVLQIMFSAALVLAAFIAGRWGQNRNGIV